MHIESLQEHESWWMEKLDTHLFNVLSSWCNSWSGLEYLVFVFKCMYSSVQNIYIIKRCRSSPRVIENVLHSVGKQYGNESCEPNMHMVLCMGFGFFVCFGHYHINNSAIELQVMRKLQQMTANFINTQGLKSVFEVPHSSEYDLLNSLSLLFTLRKLEVICVQIWNSILKSSSQFASDLLFPKKNNMKPYYCFKISITTIV